MITLFIGDSFTWGQGLHYRFLMENKGWSATQCNKFYKSRTRFENLGFEVDEFRKQNGYPALVAKYIDTPFQILNLENGGDNKRMYDTLQNIRYMCTYINIALIVIQFSFPSRSISHGIEPKRETIEEHIDHQINRIAEFMSRTKIDWLGMSWECSMGDRLKELYPDNHIPILYKNKEYNSFEFTGRKELWELTIAADTNSEITDDHFSMYGHKVIADSVISKIYSRKDLVNKLKLGEKND
jgi:hypothetical protein